MDVQRSLTGLACFDPGYCGAHNATAMTEPRVNLLKSGRNPSLRTLSVPNSAALHRDSETLVVAWRSLGLRSRLQRLMPLQSKP
jgi:hypothetical protein